MRKYILPLLFLMLSTVSVKNSFSQQIASGTYAIPGTVTLTTSATIPVTTIGTAIDALNAYGVQSGGTVQFNFADGYTETATGTNGTGIGLYTIGGAGSALFSTSYTAVIFKHNGTGKNPKLIATTLGQNSVSDYILRILGADNITFDGIDFVENPANTITPSSTASVTVAPMEYGVQILNSGADGAQNNTIKNDTITLYNFLSATSTQSSSNTYGIYQLNSTAGAKNSGNVYDHIFITRAYRGIVINGFAGSEDVGCVVSNCKIGGSNAGDIGGASTTYGGTVDAMGVRAISQQDFTFYNDTVQNVQYARTGSSGIAYGVFLSLTTGTTTFNNNKIFNVINKRTGSSSGAPTVGLEIEATSGITNVYNNFIGDLQTSTSGTTTFMLFGIRIQSAGTINVYHNSIQLPNISGSGLCSSAALCTSDGSTGSSTFTGTINVEDNILSNASNITSGSAKAYCFYFGGGTIGISNYNNFDIVPAGTKTYTGNYLGTTKQTLALWQASAGDANSKQFTTAFASLTDLHLTISAPNALYNGIFIVSPPASVTITTDIDNETRVYPIIGADEPLFTTTQVRISNNNPSDSIVSKGTTQQVLAGIVLTPLGTSNTLSSITFTTGGTYSTSSFTNIKLLYSTTNTIVGATTIATSATPASGGTLSFTGLSQSLPLGANYLFVIFDVPTGANAGDNIRVTSTPFANVVLASGTTKVGTDPVPQGGLQTVAQFYFNYPNSDITQLASWYETVSGSFNPPPDFISNNQVFNFIANTGPTEGLATGATFWVVDGTNSKIIVGDGINPVTFEAKFPVYTNSLVSMDIKNNGIVKFQSNYIPTRLGTLDQGTAVTPGSTVEYGDTAVTPTVDTIIVANYCNLTLSGFATGTRRFTPNSTIGVSRAFTPGSFTAAVNGKINFNGALVAQVIPTGFLFNNLTVNNSLVATPTTMAGNVSVDSVLKVSSNLTIGSGKTMNLTTNATATLADTLLVNGSLTVNNPIPTEITGATTLNLQFGANSNYNISANLSGANGGQIPAATWASNATINITNVTNPTANISVGAPSGVGFGNISFDAPSLSVTDTLFGGFKYVGSGGPGNPFVVTLQGNLTLGRTGAAPQTVQFKPSGKSMNVNVGGNVSQYAGTYQLSNSSTDTANFVISGKDSINGAYVYTPSTGYSSPVFILSSVAYGRLKVGGDFIMKNTSTLSETGGKAFVFFTGASAQTCIFTNVTASSATDSISMTVPGAGGVLLNSNLLVSPGVLNLTLTTGNFSIGANTLTVNGVIGTGAGTFTGSTNSNLTLSGTTAKYASVGTLYFTSGSRLLNNLTLNRTLGVLPSPSATLGTDLQINGACALTLGVFKINGNTLTLNGTYTSGLANAGSLTGSATSNLVVGSSATSAPLTFTYDALKVNNSLKTLTVNANTSLANSTTSSSLYIVGGTSFSPGNVTVNGSTVFTTHDSLTLRSNANGTAYVGQNISGSSSYLTGNVTIERYIHPLRSWRLLTAPISSNETINASWQEGDITTIATSPNFTTPNTVTGFGTQITNVLATSPAATGFDKAVTNNPSILYLNSTGHTATWAVPLNTNTTFVNSQPGFMLFVRGDRTVQVKTAPFPAPTATVLRTKGTLKEGQVTVTPPATASPAGVWGVVGNPYASEILLNGIFGSYLSSTGGAYYAYDPTLGGGAGVGAFATFVYNLPNNYSQTSTPSSSTLVPGKIESGQAFVFDFVATPNAFIKEADKGDSAILVFRPVNDDPQSFRGDLYSVNSDGTTDLDDGTLTLYDSQYSNSVNWLEDAKKLANPGENIALQRDGNLLAIEKRQPINISDTIFLDIANMKQQSYQFVFAASDITQQGLIAFLKDTYLNTATSVSLEDTTKIKFDVNSDAASQGKNRFFIVFQNPGAGPLPVTFISVKASQQTTVSNSIVVKWDVANQSNIKQYEVEKSIDGRNFTGVNTTAAILSNQSAIGYNWVDSKAVNGDNYYRIVSVSNSGSLAYSQIVKVRLGDDLSSISVYPNPVKNEEFALQLTNMPEGKYGLRLLSSGGQEIISMQIAHGGGSSTQQVILPKALAKGIYQLEVMKPDNSTSIINVVLD